jgi:hypothetical protein
MRLKNLSKAVFNLTYLTTLYINHNQLTHLPPDIAQLRNLILLDLSGNQLSEVPAELGMCTSLRELYLFDNHIQTLPPEFGNLHQLELLGVEGNPMQASLRAIIQKDGTQALISYLRDSCPVPMPPPERAWKLLLTDAERAQQESDPNAETFSLLCYNILCEKYATSHMYGYTPAWALAWEYRKELILTEIMNYESDFLCLQVSQFVLYHWNSAQFRPEYRKSMSLSMRIISCTIFRPMITKAYIGQSLVHGRWVIRSEDEWTAVPSFSSRQSTLESNCPYPWTNVILCTDINLWRSSCSSSIS